MLSNQRKLTGSTSQKGAAKDATTETTGKKVAPNKGQSRKATTQVGASPKVPPKVPPKSPPKTPQQPSNQCLVNEQIKSTKSVKAQKSSQKSTKHESEQIRHTSSSQSDYMEGSLPRSSHAISDDGKSETKSDPKSNESSYDSNEQHQQILALNNEIIAAANQAELLSKHKTDHAELPATKPVENEDAQLPKQETMLTINHELHETKRDSDQQSIKERNESKQKSKLEVKATKESAKLTSISGQPSSKPQGKSQSQVIEEQQKLLDHYKSELLDHYKSAKLVNEETKNDPEKSAKQIQTKDRELDVEASIDYYDSILRHVEDTVRQSNEQHQAMLEARQSYDNALIVKMKGLAQRSQSLRQQVMSMTELRQQEVKLQQAQIKAIDAVFEQESKDWLMSKHAAVYHDAPSLSAKLQELDITLNEEQNQIAARIVKALDEICKMNINNNQLAVAMSAFNRLVSNKSLKNPKQANRIIYIVPAGHGKSRVIMAFFYALAMSSQTSKKKEVHFFYSHQSLLDVEKPHLESINKLFGLRLKFKVRAGEVVLDKDVVYILDEVDYQMFDQKLTFKYPSNNSQDVNPWILGLTATSANNLSFVEEHFMTHTHLFSIYDSKIKDEQEEVDFKSADRSCFLEMNEIKDYAKIIYVKDMTQLQCMQEKAKSLDLTFTTNQTDVSRTRTLGSKDVLFVTDPGLMRGFDYRKNDDTAGIALLLCSQFATQRDVSQACGRVGRYGEKCRHYLDSNFDGNPINKTDQEAYQQRLEQIIQNANNGLSTAQQVLTVYKKSN